jgi:hypothetical protein
MALPSAAPSLSVPVFDDFSDPAKSTNESFPFVRYLVCLLVDSMMIVNIKCERLDAEFIFVALVIRCSRPYPNILIASSIVAIGVGVICGM